MSIEYFQIFPEPQNVTKMKYRFAKEEISEEEYDKILKESVDKEFDYSLILGSSVEKYVKEGSLNKLKAGEKSKEIFIKLPNWGDVRLNTYIHRIFVERSASQLIEETGEEYNYWERADLFYHWPVANLKIKVVPGDNSGYTKHYFYSICFAPGGSWGGERFVTKENLEEMIECLLRCDTMDDLQADKKAYYFDTNTGWGI